jgi:hypothetical protein
MSTFAEEGLKEIDELSSSSGDSFRVSIADLEQLERLEAKGQWEIRGEIRERAIDIEARMLALYQLAALKAKKAVDIDQIAKIWERPLEVYELSLGLISSWIDRGHGNPDVMHLHESVRKIRDQVRWIYDLHADQ